MQTHRNYQWIYYGLTLAMIMFALSVGLFFSPTQSNAQESVAQQSPSPTPPPADISTDALRRLLEGELPNEPQIGPSAGEQGQPSTADEENNKPLPVPEDEHATYLEAQKKKLDQQRQALVELQNDVKKEIIRLEALKAEIDQRLTQEDAATQEKIAKLVKIYEAMRPDELVPVLDKLDEQLRLQVLMRMKQKLVSQILTRMDPQKAADISKKLLQKKI